MMAKVLPEIDIELCNLCGDCVRACTQKAVAIIAGRLILDEARCAYCGDCEDLCPTGAIALPYDIIIVVAPRSEPEASDGATPPEENTHGETSDRPDR